MESLLAAGIDVKTTDKDGRTAMHETVVWRETNLDVVKALHGAGADLNAKDNDGRRPINGIWKWYAWAEMAPALMELGMEFDHGPARQFALIENEGCNIDDLNDFVRFGFDLGVKGPNGETLFHHLATCDNPIQYLNY